MPLSRRIDTLLLACRRLNVIDETWFIERFKEALDVPKDRTLGLRILEVFPELALNPENLSQAWMLYCLNDIEAGRRLPQRSEVAFIHFLIGLRKHWRKRMYFSETVREQAIESGRQRSAQLSMVTMIFH